MLAERVKNLKPSPTLALAAKAREMKKNGLDVISLSVGEPDWDTFAPVKEAGKADIDQGFTKYLPASGLAELREAVCRQTNADLGTDYKTSQVTITTGAKFVVFAAMQALIDPGDEVIIPAPYWVSYPTMAELAGGVPVAVACDKADGFKLSADKLRAAIGPKTKMLLLNSPSNPTGQVYTKEEFSALAEVLRQHPKMVVLSDDIYNRLVFDESGLAPHLLQAAPDLAERTVLVNGVSKTYSMTGWRVGWGIGPEAVIAAMGKYQSQSVSCACSISQKALERG